MSRLRKKIGKGKYVGPIVAEEGLKELFPKVEFLSFEEAREFARSLNFKGQDEWLTYCRSGKKPESIPSGPASTYKDKGWNGWGDFLGTGNVHKKDFLPFEEARKFIRKQNLKNSGGDWLNFCRLGKKPNNIPTHPQGTYKDSGWRGWKDWLGTA